MLLNMKKGEMGASTETPLSQDEQCSHISELAKFTPDYQWKALSMPWGLHKLWIANESEKFKCWENIAQLPMHPWHIGVDNF